MVQMDLYDSTNDSNNPFVVDALQCVHLKFVNSFDEIATAPGYPVEFAHQQFDETEKIVGYKNPKVDIVYSAATMNILPVITYDEKAGPDDGFEPDDIAQLIKAQLPSDQQDMLITDPNVFRAQLTKQTAFKPFGELVSKFQAGEDTFEMYRIESSEVSPEFDLYLGRVQSVSLFYINASDYTDNADEKWMHYFLYKSTKRSDGEGADYALAAYTSLYKFYAHPFLTRLRIAQTLVFPQFRKSGLGAKFLQRVYGDIAGMRGIKDITVEDPADACIYLRDYVDCINCAKLPEFSPEKLSGGYKKEMAVAANNKFKICAKQARRVYEVLSLNSLKKGDKEALAAYKKDVKIRLGLPMKRSDNFWKKLGAVLKPDEYQAFVSTELGPEAKEQQLELLYEKCIEGYTVVVERIKLHPNID